MTKSARDKKNQKTTKKQFFKRLKIVGIYLYEVEFFKFSKIVK